MQEDMEPTSCAATQALMLPSPSLKHDDPLSLCRQLQTEKQQVQDGSGVKEHGEQAELQQGALVHIEQQECLPQTEQQGCLPQTGHQPMRPTLQPHSDAHNNSAHPNAPSTVPLPPMTQETAALRQLCSSAQHGSACAHAVGTESLPAVRQDTAALEWPGSNSQNNSERPPAPGAEPLPPLLQEAAAVAQLDGSQGQQEPSVVPVAGEAVKHELVTPSRDEADQGRAVSEPLLPEQQHEGGTAQPEQHARQLASQHQQEEAHGASQLQEHHSNGQQQERCVGREQQQSGEALSASQQQQEDGEVGIGRHEIGGACAAPQQQHEGQSDEERQQRGGSCAASQQQQTEMQQKGQQQEGQASEQQQFTLQHREQQQEEAQQREQQQQQQQQQRWRQQREQGSEQQQQQESLAESLPQASMQQSMGDNPCLRQFLDYQEWCNEGNACAGLMSTDLMKTGAIILREGLGTDPGKDPSNMELQSMLRRIQILDLTARSDIGLMPLRYHPNPLARCGCPCCSGKACRSTRPSSLPSSLGSEGPGGVVAGAEGVMDNGCMGSYATGGFTDVAGFVLAQEGQPQQMEVEEEVDALDDISDGEIEFYKQGLGEKMGYSRYKKLQLQQQQRWRQQRTGSRTPPPHVITPHTHADPTHTPPHDAAQTKSLHIPQPSPPCPTSGLPRTPPNDAAPAKPTHTPPCDPAQIKSPHTSLATSSCPPSGFAHPASASPSPYGTTPLLFKKNSDKVGEQDGEASGVLLPAPPPLASLPSDPAARAAADADRTGQTGGHASASAHGDGTGAGRDAAHLQDTAGLMEMDRRELLERETEPLTGTAGEGLKGSKGSKGSKGAAGVGLAAGSSGMGGSEEADRAQHVSAPCGMRAEGANGCRVAEGSGELLQGSREAGGPDKATGGRGEGSRGSREWCSPDRVQQKGPDDRSSGSRTSPNGAVSRSPGGGGSVAKPLCDSGGKPVQHNNSTSSGCVSSNRFRHMFDRQHTTSSCDDSAPFTSQPTSSGYQGALTPQRAHSLALMRAARSGAAAGPVASLQLHSEDQHAHQHGNHHQPHDDQHQQDPHHQQSHNQQQPSDNHENQHPHPRPDEQQRHKGQHLNNQHPHQQQSEAQHQLGNQHPHQRQSEAQLQLGSQHPHQQQSEAQHQLGSQHPHQQQLEDQLQHPDQQQAQGQRPCQQQHEHEPPQQGDRLHEEDNQAEDLSLHPQGHTHIQPSLPTPPQPFQAQTGQQQPQRPPSPHQGSHNRPYPSVMSLGNWASAAGTQTEAADKNTTQGERDFSQGARGAGGGAGKEGAAGQAADEEEREKEVGENKVGRGHQLGGDMGADRQEAAASTAQGPEAGGEAGNPKEVGHAAKHLGVRSTGAGEHAAKQVGAACSFQSVEDSDITWGCSQVQVNAATAAVRQGRGGGEVQQQDDNHCEERDTGRQHSHQPETPTGQQQQQEHPENKQHRTEWAGKGGDLAGEPQQQQQQQQQQQAVQQEPQRAQQQEHSPDVTDTEAVARLSTHHGTQEGAVPSLNGEGSTGEGARDAGGMLGDHDDEGKEEDSLGAMHQNFGMLAATQQLELVLAETDEEDEDWGQPLQGRAAAYTPQGQQSQGLHGVNGSPSQRQAQQQQGKLAQEGRLSTPPSPASAGGGRISPSRCVASLADGMAHAGDHAAPITCPTPPSAQRTAPSGKTQGSRKQEHGVSAAGHIGAKAGGAEAGAVRAGGAGAARLTAVEGSQQGDHLHYESGVSYHPDLGAIVPQGRALGGSSSQAVRMICGSSQGENGQLQSLPEVSVDGACSCVPSSLPSPKSAHRPQPLHTQHAQRAQQGRGTAEDNSQVSGAAQQGAGTEAHTGATAAGGGKGARGEAEPEVAAGTGAKGVGDAQRAGDAGAGDMPPPAVPNGARRPLRGAVAKQVLRASQASAPLAGSGSQAQTQTDPEALPMSRPQTAQPPPAAKGAAPLSPKPSPRTAVVAGGSVYRSPIAAPDRKRPRVQEGAGEGGRAEQQHAHGCNGGVGGVRASKHTVQEGQQDRKQAHSQQHDQQGQEGHGPSHQQQGQGNEQQEGQQPRQRQCTSLSPFPVLRRMHIKSYAMRKRELVAAQQRLRGPQPPLMSHLSPLTHKRSPRGLATSGAGGQMKGKISSKVSGKGSGAGGPPSCSHTYNHKLSSGPAPTTPSNRPSGPAPTTPSNRPSGPATGSSRPRAPLPTTPLHNTTADKPKGLHPTPLVAKTSSCTPSLMACAQPGCATSMAHNTPGGYASGSTPPSGRCTPFSNTTTPSPGAKAGHASTTPEAALAAAEVMHVRVAAEAAPAKRGEGSRSADPGRSPHKPHQVLLPPPGHKNLVRPSGSRHLEASDVHSSPFDKPHKQQQQQRGSSPSPLTTKQHQRTPPPPPATKQRQQQSSATHPVLGVQEQAGVVIAGSAADMAVGDARRPLLSLSATLKPRVQAASRPVDLQGEGLVVQRTSNARSRRRVLADDSQADLLEAPTGMHRRQLATPLEGSEGDGMEPSLNPNGLQAGSRSTPTNIEGDDEDGDSGNDGHGRRRTEGQTKSAPRLAIAPQTVGSKRGRTPRKRRKPARFKDCTQLQGLGEFAKDKVETQSGSSSSSGEDGTDEQEGSEGDVGAEADGRQRPGVRRQHQRQQQSRQQEARGLAKAQGRMEEQGGSVEDSSHEGEGQMEWEGLGHENAGGVSGRGRGAYGGGGGLRGWGNGRSRGRRSMWAGRPAKVARVGCERVDDDEGEHDLEDDSSEGAGGDGDAGLAGVDDDGGSSEAEEGSADKELVGRRGVSKGHTGEAGDTSKGLRAGGTAEDRFSPDPFPKQHRKNLQAMADLVHAPSVGAAEQQQQQGEQRGTEKQQKVKLGCSRCRYARNGCLGCRPSSYQPSTAGKANGSLTSAKCARPQTDGSKEARRCSSISGEERYVEGIMKAEAEAGKQQRAESTPTKHSLLSNSGGGNCGLGSASGAGLTEPCRKQTRRSLAGAAPCDLGVGLGGGAWGWGNSGGLATGTGKRGWDRRVKGTNGGDKKGSELASTGDKGGVAAGSKTTLAGKRAAASAFEDLASRAAKRTRVLGGCFGGLGFLLTGFKRNQAAERESVEADIQHNGGVLVTLPPPPSPKRGTSNTGHISRRGSGVHEGEQWCLGSQSKAAFPDIVIASDPTRRTHRLLSAMSRGAAMLTSQWVHDCAFWVRYIPPEMHPEPCYHVIQPPRPHLRAHGLLAGHTVYLAGSDKFRQEFGAVMGHAGASVLENLVDCSGSTSPSGKLQPPHATLFVLEHHLSMFEGPDGPDDAHAAGPGPNSGIHFSGWTGGRRGAHSGGSRRGAAMPGRGGLGGGGRGRGSGGRGGAAEMEGGGEGRVELQAVLRTARRLRVLCLHRDEIMEVIMSGTLLPELVLPCSPAPDFPPSPLWQHQYQQQQEQKQHPGIQLSPSSKVQQQQQQQGSTPAKRTQPAAGNGTLMTADDAGGDGRGMGGGFSFTHMQQSGNECDALALDETPQLYEGLAHVNSNMHASKQGSLGCVQGSVAARSGTGAGTGPVGDAATEHATRSPSPAAGAAATCFDATAGCDAGTGTARAVPKQRAGAKSPSPAAAVSVAHAGDAAQPRLGTGSPSPMTHNQQASHTAHGTLSAQQHLTSPHAQQPHALPTSPATTVHACLHATQPNALITATPGSAVQWWGAPVSPPAQSALPPTPYRTFYSGFVLSHQHVMHVNDYVELEMLPGEVLPRIVRLQCLWEEQPSGGLPRMLARCTRMYRPEETIYGMMSSPSDPVLFSSDHTEHGIPLQAVRGRVEVLPPGHKALTPAASIPSASAEPANQSTTPRGTSHANTTPNANQSGSGRRKGGSRLALLNAHGGGVGALSAKAGGTGASGEPGKGCGATRLGQGKGPVYVCKFHYDHILMLLGPARKVSGQL